MTRSEACTIKLTRDAELDFDSDLSQSLIELIQKSVKRRVKERAGQIYL